MAQPNAAPIPTRDGTVRGVPDHLPIIYSPLESAEQSPYPGFAPGTTVHPRGSIHREGGMPLPCDVLEERDVAIVLRDGTTIYADVFRPADSDAPVAALLAWSPYGKRGGIINHDTFLPGRMDVKTEWEDGLNKFEGLNPGYWVSHGYAVVNPDARGAWKSEGDLHWFGTQEAEDEYDTIEWVAEQSWCDGKVALTGNSWLAITQWFVAAMKPPHLAAIAPWEGLDDAYRDWFCKGGIPDGSFADLFLGALRGDGRSEAPLATLDRYPLMNEYWDSKVVDHASIEVPAYVVASWTNILHTRGTFQGWRKMSSPQKWLRVHNTHEWNDYFNPVNVEDMRRFFDHFLKDVDNGWESTPRVRLTVLDPGHDDLMYRAESDFPLARATSTRYDLDIADRSLRTEPVAASEVLAYEPDEQGVTFTLPIARDTEFTGYGKVKLWVAAEEANDLDVFVTVSKLDADGQELLTEVVSGRTHAGQSGRLRVSLRALDEAASTELEPRQSFRTSEPVEPGQIVPIEIPLWPYSIRFHAGESLQLRIHGIDRLKRPEFPELPSDPTVNRGRHLLYSGGEHDSHLLLSQI
ncbi:CocE/NonD family hydrolase [Paeniglutamicibacter sp. MACA_103]|uniref:CocE/NonD family hydrolase n=1 Tax=Paeniglutamicibacter sp. MACA_103 TaxID=3377337 RepID=UPI00389538B8